jgi:hypothetical protein
VPSKPPEYCWPEFDEYGENEWDEPEYDKNGDVKLPREAFQARIFAAENLDQARGYAENDPDGGVVLRLPAMWDWEEGATDFEYLYTTKRIPPSKIQVLWTDGKWYPIKSLKFASKTVFASTDSEPVVKSGEHISLEELRQKGIADDSHCKKMNDANEKTASVGEIYSGALMSPEVQSLYHQAGQGHNRSVCNECKTAAYPLLSEARVFFEREHMYQSKVDRYAALAKAMQVPNTKDPQLLALCQDVVNTKTLYDEAARLVPEVRRTYWDRDEYRQYLKELHNLKQWKKHRQALTTLKKYVDDKVTETRNKRDVNDSIDLRKRPDRSPDYSVSLPTSKRLPNMDEQEEKMGWEEADFGDEKFSSRHMAKPKCPHCGSTKYALMPTDFETAKCDACGKNWEMGLVKGVNASFEVEAAQDYAVMFKSLLADLKTNKNSVHDHDRTDAAIRANIHWAKETLKKKDRIVWYLRLFRYSLVDNYVEGLLGQHMECDNWIKWLAAERAKLGLTPDGVIPRILQQRLEHFMSLPIPEIQNLVFTNKSLVGLIDELEKYEKEWQEQKTRLVKPHSGDKILLSFGDCSL